MDKRRNFGARCTVCNRPYEPRKLRDGTTTQTCGQTGCVAVYTRRKDSQTSSYATPRAPRTQYNG